MHRSLSRARSLYFFSSPRRRDSLFDTVIAEPLLILSPPPPPLPRVSRTSRRCWADGVVPKDDDYAKGSLRAAMKEKDWGTFGGGMSLIGISQWVD